MQSHSAGRLLRLVVPWMRSTTTRLNRVRLPRPLINMMPEPALLSGGPRRRVFTQTAIDTIRVLAAQGKSAAEIAATIGSTPASVRVKCCQMKISLRQRTRHIGGRGLVIYLQEADYAALKRKAADMQKSTIELSSELLRAVIRGDIYEAVLDDDR